MEEDRREDATNNSKSSFRYLLAEDNSFRDLASKCLADAAIDEVRGPSAEEFGVIFVEALKCVLAQR